MNKVCTYCNESKPLEMFPNLPQGKLGKYSRCKVCVAAYKKAYYQKNKKRVDAQNKKNYIKNRDSILEYKKQHYNDNRDRYRELNGEWRKNNADLDKVAHQQYYQKHKERLLAKNKEWAEQHPEKMLEYKRVWSKNNPDKINQRVRRRRAKKRGNGVYSITSKYMNRLKAETHCVYCGDKLTDRHIDHIIPIYLGGEHREGNLMASCVSCNLQKSTKYYSEWRLWKQKVIGTRV